MRHLFVINPQAFKSEADIQQYKNDIIRRVGGTAQFDIIVSRYPRDAVCVVHRYLTRHGGNTRVYAVGGDSILNDCLNGAARFPDAELTSLPQKRPPAFLRAFGEGAHESFTLPALLSARALPTDVIDLGGKLALNACAIGLPATVKSLRPEPTERAALPGGKRVAVTFMFSSMRTALNREVANQHYEVMLDGHCFSGKYSAILISNGPCFLYNKITAPQAKPNDGMLDVVLIKSGGVLKLWSILPDYLAGRHHRHLDCIVYARAGRVNVRSDLPICMSTDGEPCFDTNVSFSVAAGAVKFVAPQGCAYYTVPQ